MELSLAVTILIVGLLVVMCGLLIAGVEKLFEWNFGAGSFVMLFGSLGALGGFISGAMIVIYKLVSMSF